MKTLQKTIAALALNVFLAANVLAAGLADEAKVMVEKAIAHVKTVGAEKAYADFSTPGGSFTKGELYVFVIDMNSSVLAHGGTPKMVGKSLAEMRTADGKLLVKEFIDVVNAKGEGWVDYKWNNPETKKIQDKSTFIKKIPGANAFAGCGFYK